MPTGRGRGRRPDPRRPNREEPEPLTALSAAGVPLRQAERLATVGTCARRSPTVGRGGAHAVSIPPLSAARHGGLCRGGRGWRWRLPCGGTRGPSWPAGAGFRGARASSAPIQVRYALPPPDQPSPGFAEGSRLLRHQWSASVFMRASLREPDTTDERRLLQYQNNAALERLRLSVRLRRDDVGPQPLHQHVAHRLGGLDAGCRPRLPACGRRCAA